MSDDEVFFYAARGQSIQSYANLEQSLWMLFTHLTRMDPEIAGVIVYKIINTGTRDKLFEKLVKKRHPENSTPFWKTYSKLIGATIQVRNEIVHWNIWPSFDNQTKKTEWQLRPPNFAEWMMDSGCQDKITLPDMAQFMKKCDFLRWLGSNFNNYFINPQSFGTSLQTWHDIFLQPIEYPPPEAHPLYQLLPKPEIPPAPS